MSKQFTEDKIKLLTMAELQYFIAGWRKETFGAQTTVAAQLKRVVAKMTELRSDIYGYTDISMDEVDQRCFLAKAKKEMVDVLITLFNAADVLEFDLLEEVRQKMKINLTREWESFGDGTGQHTKKSPYETGEKE